MLKIRKISINTQLVVFLVTVVIWILLSISSSRFFTGGNIQNIMSQMAIQGVLGIAAVLVILTAGIDLSVGSVVGIINIILAKMVTSAGLPVPMAILFCLCISALFGLFNGIMVFDLKIPPFIATLGMMIILRGATLLLSGGRNVFGLPRSISNFSRGRLLGIPYLFLLLIIIMIIIEVMLKRTSFGRYIYALGSNREAARLSGVNIRFVTYGVYMLTSLLAGIAGCMETTRLWMGVPTAGMMYELDAIAAAVLGGASLMGAEGSAAGAFFGALIMATIYNGTVLLGINPFWTKIMLGSILIITVAVDQLRKRRSEK